MVQSNIIESDTFYANITYYHYYYTTSANVMNRHLLCFIEIYFNIMCDSFLSFCPCFITFLFCFCNEILYLTLPYTLFSNWSFSLQILSVKFSFVRIYIHQIDMLKIDVAGYKQDKKNIHTQDISTGADWNVTNIHKRLYICEIIRKQSIICFVWDTLKKIQ